MAITKRTLLIVEDDEFYNTVYQMHCEEVLKELPDTEGNILQAFTYKQAKHILDTQPVDFVSIDIALSSTEKNLTDEKRLARDAGGMTLLKELQVDQRQPISVVVTGETLQSYAIDAYKEYGVLTFYQKARFNDREYKNAIKAALWYLNAAEAIEKMEVEDAVESWKKAKEAAKLAGIKERDFENLGYKIQSMYDGLTHSATGLPIGRWTEEKLKSTIIGCKDNWALIYVVIKGFNNFVAAIASQEKPILNFVAELLKRTRDQFQDDKIFIGHLGYREHGSEPAFVVIPGAENIHRAVEIAGWIESEFIKTGPRPFAPAPEIKDRKGGGEQEELTFTLEVGILPNAEYTFFPDLPFLLDTLGSV